MMKIQRESMCQTCKFLYRLQIHSIALLQYQTCQLHIEYMMTDLQVIDMILLHTIYRLKIHSIVLLQYRTCRLHIEYKMTDL